jgi:hypothetical protein
MLMNACGKDWLDVNVDPNNPSSATPELVFPAAVMSAAGQVGGYYNILGGIWSQYWTQNNGSNQYKNYDAFNIQPLDLNGNFSELYSGCLNDLRFVKVEAEKDENWSFYLMATVMEAYVFQFLADVYDQIPFVEACQGAEGIFTPKYNTGQEVYDGIIQRINAALEKDLSASTVKDPGTADYLFGGDMDKWIQFANTLKLKIYMRQSYTRASLAQSGIDSLYDAGANFLAEDAAVTQFIDEAGKSNPLYESDQRQLNTNQNIKMSMTFHSWLIDNGDPRLVELFLPGSGGQKSMEQGDFNQPTTVLVPTSVSRALIHATDPVYFMSEAESYFLQAEAVLRGWGTGDVKTLYDAGVTAAFSKYGLDATEFIDSIYAYPSDSTTEVKLKYIMIQKWASMAGSQGMEAFFERNRTGYPELGTVRATAPNYVPGQFCYPINGVTAGSWAKRLLFPDTEITRNPNTPTQVPITTKVWWDKKVIQP